MRDRARQLRQTATVSEQRLWNWFRNRSFAGCKFRRQVPIGHYVIDFYCAALKLAVEVDGHHHEDPGVAETDDRRTRFLLSRGIEVVRISNELLARDTWSAEQILQAVIARRTLSLSP